MSLTTYRAYSMAEALAAVKRDLGPDAIILNTRTMKKGRFLGLGRGTIIEVVAMRADDARQSTAVRSIGAATNSKAKPSTIPSPTSAAAKRYATIGATSGSSKPTINKDAGAKSTPASAIEVKPIEAPQSSSNKPVPVTDVDREKTRQFAREMLSKLEAAATPDVAPAKSEAVAAVEKEPATPTSNVAKRFVLMDESAKSQPSTPTVAAAETRVDSTQIVHARSDETFEHLQTELSAIKQMVGHVLTRQRRSSPAAEATGLSGGACGGMPQQLFDYYLTLIAQDLSEELADQIINSVRDDLKMIDMQDDVVVRSAVLRHLASYIPCMDDTESAATVPYEKPLDDRALTIALVGPTGVGKTTTVAKLAASYKLRQGRKVGLITCDTYRIAAVDQLRTYANIIGLPLEVVLTPADMERAVWRLRECEVILIDTAGRGQKDTTRLEELRQFINAADPHEVHLVLSSTAGEKVLVQEAEAFANVGVDKLVFTKLDEAVSFGMLITVARKLGAQLSFLTTGQEVPDHLEIGRPTRLAELILGGAVHQ